MRSRDNYVDKRRSLRDTDPDKGKLLSRSEIADAIESTFPPAKNVLLPRLDERLKALVKKDDKGLERLRHYRAKDCFSLPFEMRQALASEASAAILHQQEFRQSLSQRLKEQFDPSLPPKLEQVCLELVFGTVHKYFIDQGMLLAAFLERRLDKVHIADQIVEDIMAKVLAEIPHASTLSPDMFGKCLGVLRGVFYQASPSEREYLSYLSRTSCLLVTLQSAPRLLEYLNQMGGNFRLLVGADMLVKALSERYLDNTQQQVSNLLFICKQLGSELILTEPTLNEVFTHLHAADLEFRNHYAEQEPYLKPHDISECDRIMIRAYLHARNVQNGPKSWKAFVNQMTDPEGLRTKSVAARDGLRGYLSQRFKMSYLSQEELESSVSHEAVETLAAKLDEVRTVKHADLSRNDALMVFGTYAFRRKKGESGIYDGFGFRTWWLTKETHVLSLTGDIVYKEGGVPYIMRPEFMLNFVALASKAADVRKAFADLLPTTAGLQLGQHLPAELMHQLLGDAQEWGDLPPERVSVLVSEKINRLKHDRYKRYIHQLH